MQNQHLSNNTKHYLLANIQNHFLSNSKTKKLLLSNTGNEQWLEQIGEYEVVANTQSGAILVRFGPLQYVRTWILSENRLIHIDST